MAARRPLLGVALACAAHFLVGVDGLAVAIALPALQDDLRVEPIDAQWTLTAYGLAFGGAVGVALYATLIAATGGFGAAFLAAAALAGAGVAVALRAA